MYDFQKASSWKRISAKLCDFILTVMLVVGIAWLLSMAVGYDSHYSVMDDAKARYETEYGIDLGISSEEYAALSEAEREKYDAANKAFGSDEEVLAAYSMLINLTLIIITFSILAAYLIFELFVPLIFGNGQTLGKKVFGIGVMREDGVKLFPLFLVVRTVLGKFTIEVMIPVLSVVFCFRRSFQHRDDLRHTSLADHLHTHESGEDAHTRQAGSHRDGGSGQPDDIRHSRGHARIQKAYSRGVGQGRRVSLILLSVANKK